MKRVVITVMAVIALALGTGQTLHAAPIVFFGEDLGLGEADRLPTHPNASASRNAFFNLLKPTVGTETFEGFADGTSTPLGLTFPGVGSATLTGSGSVFELSSGAFLGRYPISGNKYWGSGADFAVMFAGPVAAFGFFATDLGDFTGQATLTFEHTNATSSTLTIPHTILGPGGSVLYYGVVNANNPFTKVTFGNTSGIDFFGFDNFTVGSAAQVVPEPSTFALLGSTLLLFGGFTAWRRRRQSA